MTSCVIDLFTFLSVCQGTMVHIPANNFTILNILRILLRHHAFLELFKCVVDQSWVRLLDSRLVFTFSAHKRLVQCARWH